MNCKSCTKQSSTCGFFPALTDWRGEDFICCEPRYWETSGVQFNKKASRGNLPVAFHDPTFSDAFAEKTSNQHFFVKKENRDCFICNYFDKNGEICPVCPKNRDRYYAKKCASFEPKK